MRKRISLGKGGMQYGRDSGIYDTHCLFIACNDIILFIIFFLIILSLLNSVSHMQGLKKIEKTVVSDDQVASFSQKVSQYTFYCILITFSLFFIICTLSQLLHTCIYLNVTHSVFSVTVYWYYYCSFLGI